MPAVFHRLDVAGRIAGSWLKRREARKIVEQRRVFVHSVDVEIHRVFVPRTRILEQWHSCSLSDPVQLSLK